MMMNKANTNLITYAGCYSCAQSHTDCAKAYVSIGKITSVLKGVYGEYKENDVMV
jgi:hypothetical protein